MVQGGLEIPCTLKAVIPGTVINLIVMEKYKQLVQELYIDPKDEVLGSFLQRIEEDQQDIEDIPPKQTRPPGNQRKKRQEVGFSKDIRSFFSQPPVRKEPVEKRPRCQKT